METPRSVRSAHFSDLFRYDAWASRAVAEALRPHLTDGSGEDAAPEMERALTLLSHLLRSQTVWLGRIRETDGAHLALWERDTLAACLTRIEQNTRAWLHFLQNCTPQDFDRPLSYTNTKGQAFTSTLREIVTHVTNHGTHHRAQIVLLLRTAGAEPPATDYIFYARNRER